MATRNTPVMTLADFEHLLDVYGADRTRWPLAARAGSAALIAGDAAARRLLAEASALDDVLLRVAEPDAADVSRLSARIMAAAAQHQPPYSLDVAAMSAPATPTATTPRAIAPAAHHSQRPSRGAVRTLALLAASLMIGAFVGQSSVGARAVPVLEQLAGLGSYGTMQVATEDLHVLGDEDID